MRMHEKWMCSSCNITVFYSVIGAQRRRSPSALAIEVFESHLGSHILQVKNGFSKKNQNICLVIFLSIFWTVSLSALTLMSLFFFNAPISSILKVHDCETVNEREGKCYFSWITIFCCLEVCSRCLLDIMYLCECVCKLVFCAGDLSYVMYQLRVGVFSPLWFISSAFLHDIPVLTIIYRKLGAICRG